MADGEKDANDVSARNRMLYSSGKSGSQAEAKRHLYSTIVRMVHNCYELRIRTVLAHVL